MSALTRMLNEAAEFKADDPAQGLVRIETTRANNFGLGTVYGWVESSDDDIVTLTRCLKNDGRAEDYPTHYAAQHIVSWRYADLKEV